MALQRRVNRSWMAFGLALVVSSPFAVNAQEGFSQKPPAYTPAKDGKDLKAVLYNWAWHMGMLRGIDEHELIATLEYQGKGTVQVDGQPCSLTKYRASINYQNSGQRIQYTCTRANGKAYSAIEVVNGAYAWNEDIAGAEIVKGKGKATPMPNAVQERLIRLWTSPQGAPKAALIGANDPDPGHLPNNAGATIGKTSVAWEAGKPVVTFPIPGVAGATATATLDAKYMAERVVVKQGSTTTEFTYGDYRDWNNPLNQIDVLYAGKMAERRNGAVVRDLTTTETETGNVYVVMPVPASVKAAIKVAVQPPPVATVPRDENPFAEFFGTPPPAAANAPVARLDGKPDLTGNWMAIDFNWRYGFRRCGPTQAAGCTSVFNQTIDFEFEAPSRFGPNRPVYKPEFWDKVQQLDMWTNKYDPVMTCQPLGIPRQGAPWRIYQTAKDITFLYNAGVDGGGGYGEYRVIPTDGRKHDPVQARQTKYMGYTVGRWEGDTLVLDSISFNDQTWLARGGFFHSESMHVIERFTRQGSNIRYDITVEDPEVLAEPWVVTPRIMRPSPIPDAGLVTERGNCETYETGDATSQIRH
jgi:hypothetical protein